MVNNQLTNKMDKFLIAQAVLVVALVTLMVIQNRNSPKQCFTSTVDTTYVIVLNVDTLNNTDYGTK